MARLPFPDPGSVPEPARGQVDRFPINLTRMLLQLPESVGPYLDLAFSLMKHGSLDARVREAVILRVAALSSSEYERTQHEQAARKAGLTDEEIGRARGRTARSSSPASGEWPSGSPTSAFAASRSPTRRSARRRACSPRVRSPSSHCWSASTR